MSALHIRNVPESVFATLRERAKRHGRSMQQEALQILEAAAAEPLPGEPQPPIRLTTTRTSSSSTWRREEIYGDQGR
ncbi:MAG: FitA-like ribbon-helix-helix domain-containing protein [Streptosporangiaceae bacterium]